jgi:hypothetical protein
MAFWVLIVAVAAEQAPMDLETFGEPVCERSGKCEECLFVEIRQIDGCYATGYAQQTNCVMVSNFNNTQELAYKAPCTAENGAYFTDFSILWAGSLLTMMIGIEKWRRMKRVKIEHQETSIANIINA